MSRLVRIWIVLAIAYASGKAVVELLTDGMISSSISTWVAVPLIAACQALVLAAVARRRAQAGEES